MPQIHRALISVSDKRGLIAFAQALHALDVELISTGGTFQALIAEGIPARQVADVTGFPEILDGRVKTLHPRIYGALLAVGDKDEHLRQLQEYGIEPIDMVVVNLYPFERTVAHNDVTMEEALEQIDIGGPAMLRAAAKNFKHKVVVVNPDRYDTILEEMKANFCTVSEETCLELAREAFRYTMAYDAAISQYFESVKPSREIFPEVFHLALRKDHELRYGENPHQRAMLYGNLHLLFDKLHGKELSYNNILDCTAAARLVGEFEEPTVAIVKHNNPCGVGSGSTLAEAYAKAFATDTKSAFGGIVAVNAALDRDVAEMINEIFTEVVVAPDFADGVLEFLQKKKDRRILRLRTDPGTLHRLDIRSVPGGILVQEPDEARLDFETVKIVTKRKPTLDEQQAMLFAWRVVKHVKSNAIVYAQADRTIGIGAGQMSRVDAARIAAWKAAEMGLSVQGTAVASDAFFPFADGLLEAIHAGSTAVIQPGGSVRDEEVIAAADRHDVAMVFTGIRHFRH